jgi:hypothetical protein
MRQVCRTRLAGASRFSQPLDALPAPDLLVLFRTRSAHGVRPPELYPSRAAVRRFRRRYPPAVGTTCSTSRPRRTAVAPRRARGTEAASVKPTEKPSTSGCCSAREFATERQGFRPPRARSSPGHFSLQGVHPHGNEHGLHRASPHVVLTRDASGSHAATSGSCFPRGWLVSLETADPPGISRLVTRHSRSSRTRLGSHLLRTRGSSPSPGSPSLSRLAEALPEPTVGAFRRHHQRDLRCGGPLRRFEQDVRWTSTRRRVDAGSPGVMSPFRVSVPVP